MTPDEARELFSAAFERELDAGQAREFEAVLARDAELAREYEAFVAMLELTRKDEPPKGRDPNLLPGVQQRLRARSRGRFYGDRFAERLGSGLLQPLPLALVMLGLLALAWLALTALGLIAVPSGGR